MKELSLPGSGEIFDAYAALQALNAGLGGWLIAVFELDAAGIAALVAGCVAGAAVLGVDADRERVKQLLRYGICDFVVNGLDESLRILKSEVRRKRPVSVCLSAGLEASVREMAERGVQPELLAGLDVSGAELLQERGAVWLKPALAQGILMSWTLRDGAGPLLVRVDELAAAALEEQNKSTAWRRRWLERAPRSMGRRLAAERCVRMGEVEAARLVEAVSRDAALAARVMLLRDGAAVEL